MDHNKTLIFQQTITFLYTKDLKKTKQFYKNLLGLKIVRDQGDCIIFSLTEASFLGFCDRMSDCEKKPVIITFVTDRLIDWYEDLRIKGLKLQSPPLHNDIYKITHFFVKDPNDYTIEFQSFDEPL